jgi:hypothetical protein
MYDAQTGGPIDARERDAGPQRCLEAVRRRVALCGFSLGIRTHV